LGELVLRAAVQVLPEVVALSTQNSFAKQFLAVELIKRLGTAIGKYWIAKRGPAHIAEALECLGGNGYVEESILPRLYREAPLNSIWEGSGNVNALDVLRAITKEPQALERFTEELAPALKAPASMMPSGGFSIN
jgi:alkylation response protein AidB-like acyl-CoA dehydrogenase